jgi:hypothetical protein
MRRTLFLLAVALVAGCGTAEAERFVPREAAEPRSTDLSWREVYPAGPERLVFLVRTLVIRPGGWSVEIGVRNETGIPFELERRPGEPGYGLMLFETADLGELENASRNGTLPAVRAATTFTVPPPARLRPRETWATTMSAPGPLPDGTHLRVTFGPFRALGEPPEEMEPVVFWITDRSYRL